MKDIIEIMARAMWKLDPLDETGEMKWRYYSPEAQAAAKALKEAGYAIVPVEPTEAMYREMNAYTDVYFTGSTEDDYPTLETLYKAAIKAGDKS